MALGGWQPWGGGDTGLGEDGAGGGGDAGGGDAGGRGATLETWPRPHLSLSCPLSSKLV